MFKKIVMTLVAAGGVSACANPQYNYVPDQIAVSKPEVGQIVTVGVGEHMLTQGKYSEVDSIYLSQEVNIGLFDAYTFSPGYYSEVGYDTGSEFYLPEKSREGGRVTKAAINDPFKIIQLMKDTKSICAVTVFNGKACTSNFSLERVKRPVMRGNSFQQTLLYSGKTGDAVFIGYREFSNNMARPAFNNDVQYDLSESHEIGYKGALVRVIEATNKDITYEVLSNFRPVN